MTKEEKIICCPACDSFEVKPTPYGEDVYECIKCGTLFQEMEVDLDGN